MMNNVDYSDDERDVDDFKYFFVQIFMFFQFFEIIIFKMMKKEKKIEKKEETGKE